MARVKRGITTHKRHAKLLELTKGYRNGRRKLVKRATEAALKAGQFAYRDRRTKKRDLRGEWIIRINAAVREHDMKYSVFMNKLRQAGIMLDRKNLSQLAVLEPAAFKALVDKVK